MEKIVFLKGPDRVRKRPAVCFGDSGLQGACNAVEELLTLLAWEHTTSLRIGYEDGVVTLENNGVGLYLENWENLFSLDLWPWDDKSMFFPFLPNGRKTSVRFAGTGYDSTTLYTVTSVCREMEVVSMREGKRYTLRFHKGENVGGLKTEPYVGPSGSRFAFRLDEEVFESVALTAAFFRELALSVSFMWPDRRVVLQMGRIQQVLQGGMEQWLQEQFPGSAVFTAGLRARGKDRYDGKTYGATARIALTFREDQGFVKLYHNQKMITGGSHLQRLLACIEDYVRWRLERPVEDVQKHLCLVVSTTASQDATAWSNGTRQHLQNRMITDMTEDLLGDAFILFCKEQAPLLEMLFPEKKD